MQGWILDVGEEMVQIRWLKNIFYERGHVKWTSITRQKIIQKVEEKLIQSDRVACGLKSGMCLKYKKTKKSSGLVWTRHVLCLEYNWKSGRKW